MDRMLTAREALRLQGFVDMLVVPNSLTDRGVRRLAGNAMSVDVLVHVLPLALAAAGLVPTP
jgi:site-specific DNA-cytosine methylase